METLRNYDVRTTNIEIINTENEVENQSHNVISYETAVVPSTMRSIYWKYFGFPGDTQKNILTKSKIICVVCGSAITYNKNTSNLRTHLISRHPQIIVEINKKLIDKNSKIKKKRKIDKINEDDFQTSLNHIIIEKSDKKLRKLSKSRKILKNKTLNDKNISNLKEENFNENDLNSGSNVDSEIFTIVQQNSDNEEDESRNMEDVFSIVGYVDEENTDNYEKASDLTENLKNNIIVTECIEEETETELADYYSNDNKIISETSNRNKNFILKNNEKDFSYEICALNESNPNFNEDTQTFKHMEQEKLLNKQSNHKNSFEVDNLQSLENLDLDKNIKRFNIYKISCENIANMIIKDLISIPTISKSGLLLNELNKNIILPDSGEIEEYINKIYKEKFQKLHGFIKLHSKKDLFSVSMEVWKNMEESNLLSIYFNYYDSNKNNEVNLERSVLISVFYKTIELRNIDQLKKLLNEINLKNCCAAVLNENNEIVNKFLEEQGIPRVMCFEAIMNRCLNMIFKLPFVDNILWDIQNYIEENCVNAKDLNSVLIWKKNPWSKLNLLKVFGEHNWTNEEKGSLKEIILNVKKLNKVLQPLKCVLETMCDEPIPFCSLIKPFIRKLLTDHFIVNNDDEQIFEIKKLITDELEKEFLKNMFYFEAEFLDPRFLSLISKDDLRKSLESIKKYFSIDEDAQKEQKLKVKAEENYANRKSSLKKFFNLSKQSTNNISSIKTNIDLELNRYVNEVKVDLEQSPEIWWNENGYLFRNLNKVSQKYLCVPSCLNNIIHYDITEQIHILNKRSILTGISMNQLWFLHYNFNLN